jgi:ankyrin repeat protein
MRAFLFAVIGIVAWAQANPHEITLSFSIRNESCLTCPDYRFDLSGDGQVDYTCFKACAVPGRLHHTVLPQRVRDVMTEFYANNFLAIARTDPSRRMVSDVPIIRLSYRDALRSHEVIDIDRSDVNLRALKQHLVSAAGVERYRTPTILLYQQLLDSGWDINTLSDGEHENALFGAVLLHEPASVTFLLQHGSMITDRTMVIATWGDAGTLGELIRAARLRPEDAVVRRMLAAAARNEKSDALQFLLDFGADVNLRDTVGEYAQDYTPLLSAATNGSVENIGLLLRKGADANARDRSGRTALWHLATEDPELITLLLKHGASVNLSDNEGRTPLMRASDVCNPEAVRALLDAGADPRITDSRGRTALRSGIVQMQKCNDTSALLQEALNVWSTKRQ